jgi:energy-coupling factor transporter ATP-binding protein EcfA2
MVWFRELGFEENPLDLRPNINLVGLEVQEKLLINHILKEEICFLNGLTGSGKTSLLKKIQETMKEHHFIYLDAQDIPYNFNLEDAIKGKKTFLDKITLREYPKKSPVLIIDEFQETDKNLILEARGKWENKDNQKIKSIVICQISKTLKNVTPAFKERLGNRHVTLKTLDDDEMKEILKIRLFCKKNHINYYYNFDEEALNLLVDLADGNPRRLLEYTDLVFDFHFQKFGKINPIKKESYKITYWGTKEILSLNEINVESYKYKNKTIKERNVEMFERMFDKEKQKALKYLMTGPKTIDEFSEFFKISKNKSRKIINELRNKKAIVTAGKRDKKMLWQTSQHIKRLTVDR